MFGKDKKTEKTRTDKDTHFYNLDGMEYAHKASDGLIYYSDAFTDDQMDIMHGCYLDDVPVKAIAYPEVSPVVMLAAGVAWVRGRKLYHGEYKKVFCHPLTADDLYILTQAAAYDYGDLEYTDILYDAGQFYRHTMVEFLVALSMAGFPLFKSVKHPHIRAFTPEIILYFHTTFIKTYAGEKDFKKLIKMLEETYIRDDHGRGKYHLSKDMKIMMRRFCYECGVYVPGDEALRVSLNRARLAGMSRRHLPKELKTDLKFEANPIGEPLRYDFIDPVWVGPKHETYDDRGDFEPSIVSSRIL